MCLEAVFIFSSNKQNFISYFKLGQKYFSPVSTSSWNSKLLLCVYLGCMDWGTLNLYNASFFGIRDKNLHIFITTTTCKATFEQEWSKYEYNAFWSVLGTFWLNEEALIVPVAQRQSIYRNVCSLGGRNCLVCFPERLGCWRSVYNTVARHL